MSATMSKPKRANPPKFSAAPVASGKWRSKLENPTAIIGVDLSPASIALAALNYDPKLKKIYGPGFHMHRWKPEDHYFTRMKDLAKAFSLVNAVLNEVKFFGSDVDVWIAVEEPWPFGMVGRAQSQSLKQQAEMSGAFLGGLLRNNYQNIFQIQANSWRKIVADDLGITTHHSKWKDPALAAVYNCTPGDTGKFRAKQWALQRKFPGNAEIPDWPEIINHRQLGRIPRPADSRHKAIQCDDRYDALAVMMWMRDEWYRELK